MGRHSAATTHWTPASGEAARYVGRVGALAVALGIGAAVAGGAGIANADGSKPDSPGDKQNAQSAPDAGPSVGGPGEASGKDPQTHRSEIRRPNLLKDALRVPRMVLGANGGASGGSTPRPGVTRAKTPAVTTSGSAIDAPVDAISSLPQRITIRALTSPRGNDRTYSPRHLAADAISVKPLADVVRPADAGGERRTSTPTTALAPIPAAVTATPKLPSAVTVPPGARTDDAPLTPVQSLIGVLGLISRDIEQTLDDAIHGTSPTTSPYQGAPAPGDVVQTPYGTVGKWMLNPDGSVANWGGQAYGDTTLREPVNVIIVDPNSKSPQESTARLNSAMFWSGFPAQPIHSTGFDGTVLGTTYDQLPGDGTDAAYSDLPFFLPNDHARVFGPAPVASEDGTGYLWTAAASTEIPGIYDTALTHRYLSYDLARDMLALRLILSGQATLVGIQRMDNVYNDGTVSTGDHDGYAIVLRLN
ncbi:MAG: hypothetical protein ABW001_11975 [Mycobacterium sp.]